jgi:hypothetical protein
LVPLLELVVMSPGAPYSAVLPTPCTRISAIDSTEGNRLRRGLLPVTLVTEMPSTLVSVWAGSPPWIENPFPLSGCTPGSVAIRLYGVVLPPARTLAGRLITFSEFSDSEIAAESVTITPA